jgi:hypothetical protein
LAWRSSSALAAAALAVALAGCETNEPDVRPFRIRATLADGAALESLSPESTFHVLYGAGEVLAPTRLRLAGATYADGRPLGDLTLEFDGGAAPAAVFGRQLDGVPVRLLVLADPNARGADGGPLPIVGFRIAIGQSPGFRHQLLLWEATFTGPGGLLPVVFAPAGWQAEDPGFPNPGSFPDIPDFLVSDVYSTWEPGECGLVYYDVLNAVDPRTGARAALARGDEERLPVGTVDPPWLVRNVQTWHRDGRCDGQAQAWTQFAAWRPAPAAP